MELSLFIYLADIIPSFGNLFAALSFVSVLCSFVLHLAWLHEVFDKYYKSWVVVPLVLATVACIIPSQRTMYKMAGAYFTQEVVLSDTAGKVKKLLDSKLDEYIIELEKSAKTK